MPSPTMTKIGYYSVPNTTTTQVVFSNIPSNYNDLFVIASARVSRNSGGQYGYLKVDFNNGGAGTYSYDGIWQSPNANTSVNGQVNENGPYATFMLTTDNWTANSFGNVQINIPGYADSNTKMTLSRGGNGGTDISTTDGYIVGWTATKWSLTTAVSSLRFYPDATYIMQGSQFWLYGIKNS